MPDLTALTVGFVNHPHGICKVIKPKSSIDESEVVIEKQEDMLFSGHEYLRPAHAVSAETEELPWD